MTITRNHAEAEDLVQDTYLRALKTAERLRENSNIKGWLFTILRNLWFNQLRERRSSPAIVEIDGEDYTADSLIGNERDAHAILESNQDAIIVRSAIDDLSRDSEKSFCYVSLKRFLSGNCGCPWLSGRYGYVTLSQGARKASYDT
jgi:RNA polymerase sigma-70 factor (ECF subfamily)